MAKTVEGPELVPRREAARLAGVHYNTIRLWERQGYLETSRGDGGDIMVSLEQLEDVIRRRKEGAGAIDAPRIAALEAENRLLREERDRLVTQLERVQQILERVIPG